MWTEWAGIESYLMRPQLPSGKNHATARSVTVKPSVPTPKIVESTETRMLSPLPRPA